MANSKLMTLAFDAVKNNDENLSNAIRNKILEVCDGEWDYFKFMDNRYKVFAVMAEVMPAAVQAGLGDKFDSFAEFKDEAMGDDTAFWVEDNEIYTLVTSSRGNGDVERNKIVDRNFKVPTENKSIKFYDELDMFMSDRMDLGRMTDKAVTAHINYVGELISDTIYNSYSSVGTDYKFTGSFDAAELMTIMEHVKAATGAERLQIWGTSTALANVSDIAGYSDLEKEMFNGFGFYGTFRGADLIALPQAYRAGNSGTFAVNNDYIIILPADEKIVKVAYEGVPFVGMQEGMDRNDLQTEILYQRRVGAAAITLPDGKYGLYKFS